MLGISLQSNTFAVEWSSIVIKSTGAASADSDIASVSVWTDVNGNGAIDPGDEKIGFNTFLASSSLITFNPPQTVAGTKKWYLITVDAAINAIPGTGERFGVVVATYSDIIINSPNTISIVTKFHIRMIR